MDNVSEGYFAAIAINHHISVVRGHERDPKLVDGTKIRIKREFLSPCLLWATTGHINYPWNMKAMTSMLGNAFILMIFSHDTDAVLFKMINGEYCE